MSTITKQWLQQKIAEMEEHRDLFPGDLDDDCANVLSAFRITLASLEAEAVCVIDQSNLDYLNSGSDADVWPASRTEMGDVLLYRSAPPAPVSAPDESAVELLATDLMKLIDKITGERHSVATLSSLRVSIVESCRAAMLQGAENVKSRCSNSPVIPDGYCIMPLKLTADNGAKGALCGEFHVQYRIVCQSCVGEGCEDCNHTGGWDAEIPVSWDTIKRIHKSAVEACAYPAAPQQETK
ncbi:hypothetical protein A3464_18675 [Enterobacter genomosp. O]|uniref:hypothetical protein n=1 Tax=Enterobacter genomosp. O TaxID=2364150 RepID=UPI0007B3F5C5|nr:hypothetical protein [Enterobacter genomosp. O]KZQ38511.1 hypothetical protein A3464_18675 [Enterobacter genomosp. O]